MSEPLTRMKQQIPNVYLRKMATTDHVVSTSRSRHLIMKRSEMQNHHGSTGPARHVQQIGGADSEKSTSGWTGRHCALICAGHLKTLGE